MTELPARTRAGKRRRLVLGGLAAVVLLPAGAMGARAVLHPPCSALDAIEATSRSEVHVSTEQSTINGSSAAQRHADPERRRYEERGKTRHILRFGDRMYQPMTSDTEFSLYRSVWPEATWLLTRDAPEDDRSTPAEIVGVESRLVDAIRAGGPVRWTDRTFTVPAFTNPTEPKTSSHFGSYTARVADCRLVELRIDSLPTNDSTPFHTSWTFTRYGDPLHITEPRPEDVADRRHLQEMLMGKRRLPERTCALIQARRAPALGCARGFVTLDGVRIADMDPQVLERRMFSLVAALVSTMGERR